MTNLKENIQFGANNVSRQCKKLNLIQWIRNGFFFVVWFSWHFLRFVVMWLFFPLYVSNYKPYLWIFGRLFHCTPVFCFFIRLLLILETWNLNATLVLLRSFQMPNQINGKFPTAQMLNEIQWFSAFRGWRQEGVERGEDEGFACQ